jgi:hypothetical protein
MATMTTDLDQLEHLRFRQARLVPLIRAHLQWDDPLPRLGAKPLSDHDEFSVRMLAERLVEAHQELIEQIERHHARWVIRERTGGVRMSHTADTASEKLRATLETEAPQPPSLRTKEHDEKWWRLAQYVLVVEVASQRPG